MLTLVPSKPRRCAQIVQAVRLGKSYLRVCQNKALERSGLCAGHLAELRAVSGKKMQQRASGKRHGGF